MTKIQTKNCKNCEKKFEITEEDQVFYNKIFVPAPTFCPDCRLQRRLAFRNERILYKRDCDLCGKSMVTIYYKDAPFPVYCTKCWYGNKWDGVEYGHDYDFNKQFFEQWNDLMNKVPKINLMNVNSVNSDYCNMCKDNKNCYLSFGGDGNEEVLYSTYAMNCKNAIDVYIDIKSEFSYNVLDSNNCFKLNFSQNCEFCIESYFLLDCRNCQNCFGCIGLRNKSYNIFNKQYSKEEYFEKIKEFDLGSFSSLKKAKQDFEKQKLKYPHKFANINHSKDIIGNNVTYSNNCKNCFDVNKGAENCKFLFNCGWDGKYIKDSYDMSPSGWNVELYYEGTSIGFNINKVFCSNIIWTGMDIIYSYYCESSSNLFGCVGLKNKQYCILNKQYSKKEYEELAPKIIEHMGG